MCVYKFNNNSLHLSACMMSLCSISCVGNPGPRAGKRSFHQQVNRYYPVGYYPLCKFTATMDRLPRSYPGKIFSYLNFPH